MSRECNKPTGKWTFEANTKKTNKRKNGHNSKNNPPICILHTLDVSFVYALYNCVIEKKTKQCSTHLWTRLLKHFHRNEKLVKLRDTAIFAPTRWKSPYGSMTAPQILLFLSNNDSITPKSYDFISYLQHES